VVGATLDDTDDNGVDGGSVYVFVRDENGGGWNEQAILLASDGVDGDNFGYDVATYNDALIVGTGKDDDDEVACDVFTRDEQSWTGCKVTISAWELLCMATLSLSVQTPMMTTGKTAGRFTSFR